MKHLLSLMIVFLLPLIANADYYSCPKMVYKEGWLKNYQYLGETWGANIRKHGLISSSGGSSVERTTSSVDPGVSTGRSLSSSQYSSSWGECNMLDIQITQKMREEYIEQNLGEIKKQVALGEGLHIDSLAFVSGCKNIDRQQWTSSLQQRTADFYDVTTGQAFATQLNSMIESNQEFKSNCRIM